MNRLARHFGLFLILSIMYSCEDNSITSNTDLEVHIASDYLEIKDSVLFKSFTVKSGIRVQIHPMSVNQIIGHLRNKEYNSGLDVIMVKSLHGISRISRNDFLQPIEDYLSDNELTSKFNSKKYQFIGLGIDPYIFTYHKDSSMKARTYADLKLQPFVCALSDEELIPFFASLMPKLNRSGTYTWIKDFKENTHDLTDRSDSIHPVFCLNNSSSHKALLNDKEYRKRFNEFYFPNQNGEGVFYDLKTVAIVYQAENFASAEKFINYCSSDPGNKLFNKKTGTIPIHSNTDIRLYRISSEELIQYYSMINRLLNKFN